MSLLPGPRVPLAFHLWSPLPSARQATNEAAPRVVVKSEAGRSVCVTGLGFPGSACARREERGWVRPNVGTAWDRCPPQQTANRAEMRGAGGVMAGGRLARESHPLPLGGGSEPGAVLGDSGMEPAATDLNPTRTRRISSPGSRRRQVRAALLRRARPGGPLASLACSRTRHTHSSRPVLLHRWRLGLPPCTMGVRPARQDPGTAGARNTVRLTLPGARLSGWVGGGHVDGPRPFPFQRWRAGIQVGPRVTRERVPLSMCRRSPSPQRTARSPSRPLADCGLGPVGVVAGDRGKSVVPRRSCPSVSIRGRRARPGLRFVLAVWAA